MKMSPYSLSGVSLKKSPDPILIWKYVIYSWKAENISLHIHSEDFVLKKGCK